MKVQILTGLVLLILLAACAQASPQAQSPVTAENNPETTLPAQGEERELVVMAAASLTEPFTDISNAFEQEHPAVSVVLNFAGSQQLAQQLAQGAPADVFASANQRQMQAAVTSGRIRADQVKDFTGNELVIVLPADNPGEIETLADLTTPGIKLILAAEEVPVGEYSLEALAKAADSGVFGQNYKEQVLANAVSYEENVRSVLTKISLGEGDAGMVYSSDAGTTGGVVTIAIPPAYNIRATYPIAPVADSDNPDIAASFVNYVLSETGQEVLNRYGFLSAE